MTWRDLLAKQKAQRAAWLRQRFKAAASATRLSQQINYSRTATYRLLDRHGVEFERRAHGERRCGNQAWWELGA